MSEDRPLRSAYELAMERLRAKDRREGIEEEKPLTDKQKEEIARLRQEAEAKIAELEILHREDVSVNRGDPAKLAEIQEKHRIDRERVASRLESSIARVRAGRPAREDD